ncbi:helix-turn-helix domain-containing protein [Nocardioides halotolerans]|uniref:helix-turn-helix domain-containing protein n=1 Tax=Nocardioides halotolerans TaxID=433660 RepID=UPI0006855AB2|nr:helix-turn-helix transcriptional regulator [Nocardioides halotolerans]
MATAPERRLATGRLLLGARVRALRADSDLHLADLAEGAGISLAYLSDIERGRKLPSLLVLDTLATTLRMTVVELLDDIYPWGTAQTPRTRPAPPPDGRAGRTVRHKA